MNTLMSLSQPEAEPTVARVSSDVREELARLAGSDVLKSGAVNVIGLEAVRKNLGERWEAKRARVWEHLERELVRRLAPHDMYFRLDEVSYVIAMPHGSRFVAQATCLSILEDVLKFFLGESHMRDVVVRNVTSVDDGQVVSSSIDPSTIAEAGDRHRAQRLQEPTRPNEEWKPPLAGRTHAVRVQTETVKAGVEVRMGVESVWNLRRGLITSFVLDREVRPAVDQQGDVLKVDTAVMAYAGQLLHEHRQRGGRFTLHVPVNYASVAAQRPRENLLRGMADVRDVMRQTVLLEITGLDAGIPQSRLIEVVALLKPFCLGVLARPKPSRKAIEGMAGCGFQGLVLDVHGLGRTLAETKSWMKGFADLGGAHFSNLIVHGLPSKDLVDEAAKAGMTHASVRPEMRFEKIIAA